MKRAFGIMLVAASFLSFGCGETESDNVCEGVSCSGHGVCVVSSIGASCVCTSGYKNSDSDALSCVSNGQSSESVVTSCEGQTCSGHGTCVISGNTASCKCDSGYNAVGMVCTTESVTSLVTAEDWARARIAGTVTTEEAFKAISTSSGFPVVTDDNSVIFMHWYNDGDWSVAGDFNNWEKRAMTHDGDLWYAEVDLPADVQSKDYYKFVNNGTDYRADPWAIRYTYTEDGEISYIVQPAAAHLMRWHNIQSPQGLKSRTIRAYIPKNYDASAAYDVLYAHDGQNLFGPGSTYGSWKVEDAMAAVGANFIVVGIDNTEDRMSEYVHVDESVEGYGSFVAKGKEYAAFVNDTVRPFIEKRFKTTDKRGLMGSSLGGLISLYIAHLYPGQYYAALALSPTTAWGRFSNDNGTTIEDLYVQSGHQSTILYLDNGGYAPDSCEPLNAALANSDESNTDNYCFTRHFVDTMANIGYSWDTDLFHNFDPGALHNEDAWAKRIRNPETSPLNLMK